jgi:hypothetical protein
MSGAPEASTSSSATRQKRQTRGSESLGDETTLLMLFSLFA